MLGETIDIGGCLLQPVLCDILFQRYVHGQINSAQLMTQAFMPVATLMSLS